MKSVRKFPPVSDVGQPSTTALAVTVVVRKLMERKGQRSDGSGWQWRLECGGRSEWQNKYNVCKKVFITDTVIMPRTHLLLLFIWNDVGRLMFNC